MQCENCHSNPRAFSEFRALPENALLAKDLGGNEDIVMCIQNLRKSSEFWQTKLAYTYWRVLMSFHTHLLGRHSHIALPWDYPTRYRGPWSLGQWWWWCLLSLQMISMIGPLPIHGKLILSDMERLLIWNWDFALMVKFQDLNSFEQLQCNRSSINQTPGLRFRRLQTPLPSSRGLLNLNFGEEDWSALYIFLTFSNLI